MPVSSRALVDLVLLGPTHDRRQLQDSPILGDVWLAFANKPAQPQDLLLSPYRARPAGPVAALISKRLQALRSRGTGQTRSRGRGRSAAAAGRSRTARGRTRGEPLDDAPYVAYLQGLVAARLYFPEVLELIVPMTGWWSTRRKQLAAFAADAAKLGMLEERLALIVEWAKARNADEQDRIARSFASFAALDRYVALAGLILWAGSRAGASPGSEQGLGDAVGKLRTPKPVAEALWELLQRIFKTQRDEPPAIWQVSLNRPAMPALDRSVPAVKGDAARTLFKVKCDEIVWAVVDSGIDGGHEVFRSTDKTSGLPMSRVVRSFDFSNIRRIVSLDNLRLDPKRPDRRVKDLIAGRALEPGVAVEMLRTLAKDAENDRPVNWPLVERFVEIDPKTTPASGHGTHVAGIIGADAQGNADFADGMCPDIRLYDFRVLGAGASLADTEFAIIAALQYIRYLNESRSYMSIHGVNLSLSIPHDVRNFACGRTPICNECERLVDSGIVVVAAAGNMGYHSFETSKGSYEGYAAFSITDPGNADSVLTVGATHRSWPHTYGVSFFSSRGPTGDGRMKPDLVAPGERIRSSTPGGEWKELDGTSMAAPHVSGAAAMLMARYAELVGQPRRIKQLLCDTATDLGRERSFQGCGMLDVLRAFQRV